MPNWCAIIRAVRAGRYRICEKALTPELQIVGREYNGTYTYIDKNWPAGQGVVVHTTNPAQGLVVQKNRVVNYVYDEPVPDVDYVAADYYHEEVSGHEKRVDIGDIIDYKPYHVDYWQNMSATQSERFFVIPVANEEEGNMDALCEPYFDTSIESYRMDLFESGDWVYPRDIIMKRRMNIPLTRIQILGVDMEQLMDWWTEYRINIPMQDRIVFFDKLNDRDVLNSDGLNTIQPLQVP